jgi:hypothetical protein
MNNKPAVSVLVISGALIVFYFIYKLPVLLIIALGFIFIGIISSRLTLMIHRAWMAFAKALGFLNSRILLTLMYVFFLTPLALLRRAVGREKKDRDTSTNFFARNHVYTKTDLEKPF